MAEFNYIMTEKTGLQVSSFELKISTDVYELLVL